jgi:benzoyl-CoA reductase/2-hydroxyglutaryl-CoA dehydratase subunit BcrC/BadD/HgdB
LIKILKKNIKLTKPNNNEMDGFNIVVVIAIILFARLGVRLVTGYIKLKKEEIKKSED